MVVRHALLVQLLVGGDLLVKDEEAKDPLLLNDRAKEQEKRRKLKCLEDIAADIELKAGVLCTAAIQAAGFAFVVHRVYEAQNLEEKVDCCDFERLERQLVRVLSLVVE